MGKSENTMKIHLTGMKKTIFIKEYKIFSSIFNHEMFKKEQQFCRQVYRIGLVMEITNALQ